MSGERERAAIAAALEAAKLPTSITTISDLSGGCVHRVFAVVLRDGRRFVAKVNKAEMSPLFEEESVGLTALAATRTVVVPEPLATIVHGEIAVLLMTFIAPLPRGKHADREQMWRNFGEDLAALHLAPLLLDLTRGYGFCIDNHLGTTPQPNGWRDDWVTFNAGQRFGHQLRLARSHGLLDANEARRVEDLITRLDRLLPLHPKPSLLHGDLWSGNALPTAKTKRSHNIVFTPTCAVIDPAPYIGDALADIAMMRLFGGFDDACFDAWSKAMHIDLAEENVARRIAAYQLYHVLNHVNIFGRGYVPQAMQLVKRLLD